MAKFGRPPFKTTPALRRKVQELVAGGLSKEDVARAIGCTLPTLMKHFVEDLEVGTARKRAEVLAMLFKAARRGNVAAIKKLEEMTRLASAEQAVSGSSEERPALGKKDNARRAARTAGADTEWGEDLLFDGGTSLN